MSGQFVMIDLHFPKWITQLGAHETEIYALIAATMQTNRALMFDSSNAGRTPWAKPLLREGQPLSQKGALRQSFAPTNDGRNPTKNEGTIVKYSGNVVTIGTNIKYAAILNSGGVIRPRNFPVLWIPLPDGSAKSSNAPSETTKGIVKAHKKEEKLKKQYKESGSQSDLDELKAHRAANGGGGAPIVVGRNGKIYLLAKKATIPARPMTEWNSADQEELEGTLSNKVAQVLNATE